jgi:hypothetical protein
LRQRVGVRFVAGGFAQRVGGARLRRFSDILFILFIDVDNASCVPVTGVRLPYMDEQDGQDRLHASGSRCVVIAPSRSVAVFGFGSPTS